MRSAAVTETTGQESPLIVTAVKWWGYLFSAMYWLYGGVKLVLSILDRQYVNLTMPVLYLGLGVLMLLVTFAFRDGRPWGWYGLIVINGAAVVLSVLGLGHVENIAMLIISGLALVGLLAPPTKSFIFRSR